MIEKEAIRKLRCVINRMLQKRREVSCSAWRKKVEEISEILDISVNTVKKHKKEACEYIRKVLSPDISILLYRLLKRLK